MKERNTCIEKVKEEAKEQMLKTVVNPTNYMYKGAIKNLIIQVILDSNSLQKIFQYHQVKQYIYDFIIEYDQTFGT